MVNREEKFRNVVAAIRYITKNGKCNISVPGNKIGKLLTVNVALYTAVARVFTDRFVTLEKCSVIKCKFIFATCEYITICNRC